MLTSAVDRPSSQRGSRPPRNRPSSSGKGDRRKAAANSTLMSPNSETRLVATLPDADEDPESLRRRFKEIDDRRFKEWNNYQIARSVPDDGYSANLVFLDVSIAEAAPYRVNIRLFDETPATAANFRALALGERGFDQSTGLKLDYVDSGCRRIVPGLGAFFGELAPGVSICADGGTFRDENFAHRHTERGMLSMANRGPHSNGSAFFVSFAKSPALDFHQVVFGQVMPDCLSVLDAIEKCETTRNGTPTCPITISFCGALTGRTPQRSMSAEPLSAASQQLSEAH
jgi:peptidylprolyl isomerase